MLLPLLKVLKNRRNTLLFLHIWITLEYTTIKSTTEQMTMDPEPYLCLKSLKHFKRLLLMEKAPKDLLFFLHLTGEENGLLGSKYYTENPLYPLANTIANLNIDMVGRTDPKRESSNPNYIYLIGSDRLSTELHVLSEEVNKATVNLDLDYTYNAHDDPNRFYFRSDHYNFG